MKRQAHAEQPLRLKVFVVVSKRTSLPVRFAGDVAGLRQTGQFISRIHFLDGCALCLVFRAIALTLRAGLHSQPLMFEEWLMEPKLVYNRRVSLVLRRLTVW